MLFLPIIISKILKLPSIVEINGIPFEEGNLLKTKKNIKHYITNPLSKFDWWISCKFSDKIVAVSEGIKKELHQKYRVASSKIVVIPNGANIDLFKPMDKEKIKEELKLDKNAHYICFVGNLAIWQGVEYLVKSAPLILREIPNTKFLIIGSGVMKEELVEMVKELKLEGNFIFMGAVDYELVPKYVNASDICVAPFVKERIEKLCFSPVKIYEYMACAKPIITTRISGLANFLEDNKDVLFVEPNDVDALGNAIIKLLKDSKLAKDLSKNTFEISKKYSWNATAKKILRVCQDVVEDKKE